MDQKKSRRARNGATVERNGMNSKRKAYGNPDFDQVRFACASSYSSPGYRRFMKKMARRASRRQGANLLREYMS